MAVRVERLTSRDVEEAMAGEAARKMIQKALGVTADGAIGPATMKAIQEADGKDLLEKFSHSKEAFYKSLPTFGTYGKGWLKRVADVQTSASTMIG